MTPKLSVICFTCRPGGIDVLFTGLRHQEFQDFELVLVDGLYTRRAGVVADKAAEYGLRVCHIPPKRRDFPNDSIPSACNTAIAHVTTDLVVWFVDYTFAKPQCLSSHWRVWEETQHGWNAMGAHEYVFPPTPAFELPGYAPIVSSGGSPFSHEVSYVYHREESLAYVSDLSNGVYDPWMYSIFSDPLERPEDILTLASDPIFGTDPKMNGVVSGKIRGFYLHLKNESMPMSRLLSTNGLDESYGHVYPDVDLGMRLEALGVQWVLLGPEAWVTIVNPRHIFPHLLLGNTVEAHKAKYEAVFSHPERYVRAENAADLSDVRASGLRWYR